MDREREKEEEGNENVMTKEIVVKAWPAHVVETFGQQGGWTWLLRLLEARGAAFDNKRDAFTSGEMAKNLMPPRLMESACAALAAATGRFERVERQDTSRYVFILRLKGYGSVARVEN